MTNKTIFSYIIIFTLLSSVPLLDSASCDNRIQETNSTHEKPKTLQLKLVAIASILLAGALGITIPIYGNKTSTFNPENNIFFLIKAFAAGVILATGFVHILPDAFESLSNPCLERNPWGEFPFAGFVAMISAVFTMMIESLATGYYKRCHVHKEASNGDEEKQIKQVVDVHTHASHGHAHGSDHLSSLFRHRIVSQVLEVGIVVHSVIIGVSLGASTTTNIIKPLVAALTFHQFFEGMGLGGCISQANFRGRAIGVVVVFFSVTTPIGIGIGIGISQTYNENTSTALVVQGVLSSASAGILIYMALVDLLAEDFMNPKLQTNVRLQLAAYMSLILGMSCMSVLAKWA